MSKADGEARYRVGYCATCQRGRRFAWDGAIYGCSVCGRPHHEIRANGRVVLRYEKQPCPICLGGKQFLVRRANRQADQYMQLCLTCNGTGEAMLPVFEAEQ